MSSDNTANDTMRRYEHNNDVGNGDQNPTAGDVQPAVSPAPDDLGNDDSDNPIPTATPQSPVQTEDSPEAEEDNSPEVRDNKESGRAYREV